LTELISLSCEAFNASTCHSSQGKTVIDFTFSILNTRLKCCARIFALSSVVGNYTGLLAWTFLVHLASIVFNHWLGNYINEISFLVLIKDWLQEKVFLDNVLLGVQATP
jgi:hypothetical protein